MKRNKIAYNSCLKSYRHNRGQVRLYKSQMLNSRVTKMKNKRSLPYKERKIDNKLKNNITGANKRLYLQIGMINMINIKRKIKMTITIVKNQKPNKRD